MSEPNLEKDKNKVKSEKKMREIMTTYYMTQKWPGRTTKRWPGSRAAAR